MSDLNLTEEQKDVLISRLIAQNKRLKEEVAQLKNAEAVKKKFEFSKIIFLGVSALTIAITVFSCYMIWDTKDMSALGDLIGAVFLETAATTGFYHNKAKAENKIKLMAKYGVKPEAADFSNI